MRGVWVIAVMVGLFVAGKGVNTMNLVSSMQVVDTEKMLKFSLSQLGLSQPDQRILFDYLMGRHENGKRAELLGFSFTNCGNPQTDLTVVSNVNIKPDPIPKEGNVTLTADIVVRQNITAKVQASVEVKKKILGEWIKVPCIDDVGSCSYDDICPKLPAKCPPIMQKYKLPCHCPFAPGHFSIPGITLALNLPSETPSGEYKATIKASVSAGQVGCFEVEFSIK